MSQRQKLLERLLTKPKDFTWNELESLLSGFGYKLATAGKTGGSRRRFVHSQREPITLHKPHPGNELRAYQVSQLIEHLKSEGLV